MPATEVKTSFIGCLGKPFMMFPQRLDYIARLTEARLKAVFVEKSQSAEADGAVSERLFKAVEHAALGGGKRFRPFLTVETAALFGVAPELSITAAAAVECLHCYSLVHDDLPVMDNDELRRGQPTVWRAFDEWTAILAGDALLTLAFEMLASPEAHADPAVRLKLVSGLAVAGGVTGMVGGQALDLEAEKLGSPVAPGLAYIQRLQGMKTGALITFACEAGAMLGGAGRGQRQAIRDYGVAVGLAFQIADDLLDAEGDAATVGKAVAKDAAAGKATLVSLMGLEAARAELARVEQAAIDAVEPFGARGEVLAEAARFVARREK
jgi:farnesyl diphosphate synthase